MRVLVLLNLLFAVIAASATPATVTATFASTAGQAAITCIDPNSTQTLTITQFSADMIDTTEANSSYVVVFDGVTDSVVYQRLLATTPSSRPSDHLQDAPVASVAPGSGFTFPQGHKGCIEFTANATHGLETVNLTGTVGP